MKANLWLRMSAAAVYLVLTGAGCGSDLSCDSPRAVAEFEAAVEARMMYYEREERMHLERALELDPGFVLAKVHLADSISTHDPERAARLLEEASRADLERLTAHERFLVRRAVAFRDGRQDEARAILEEHLEKYPEDAWALYTKAEETLVLGDVEGAERILIRLLGLNRNHALAYNNLGYLAMASGRFEEAEEYFTSYRFIAPDQANPHDSLGELFVIVGRYDDALECFETALSLKPDFWISYQHIALLHLLRRDPDGVASLVPRLSVDEECPAALLRGIECLARSAELAESRDWRQVVAGQLSDCARDRISGQFVAALTHRAACELGRWEDAIAVEEDLAEPIDAGGITAGEGAALVQHLEAVRLAFQGRLEEAAKRLLEVDSGLDYDRAGGGVFRLYNRLVAVEVLLGLGRDARAYRLLERVRSANPAMATVFEQMGLEVLGLPGNAA